MRVPIDEAFKGGQSDPRNPLLHKMFSYLGYGERAGSGLSMINEVWKGKGWIVPKLEETFKVVKNDIFNSSFYLDIL